MNSRRYRPIVLALFMAIAALGVASPANPGPPGPQTLEFSVGDYSTPATGASTAIPPDSTIWWLYEPGPPAIPQIQEAYLDDGDGMISVGDSVVFQGLVYPVTGVDLATWTSKIFCRGADDCDPPEPRLLFGPADPGLPGMDVNPDGWFEYDFNEGLFGYGPIPINLVFYWVDANGNLVFDAPDRLLASGGTRGGFSWTVDFVTVTVSLRDFEAVGVTPKHWGEIKALWGSR